MACLAYITSPSQLKMHIETTLQNTWAKSGLVHTCTPQSFKIVLNILASIKGNCNHKKQKRREGICPLIAYMFNFSIQEAEEAYPVGSKSA